MVEPHTWATLAPPWQACIAEAWTAYCHGSLPIGAAITDGAGTIRARGRNRIGELTADSGLLAGRRLAHAEVNALLALDWSSASALDPRACTLYTTTEPCPLCVGATRMTRLGALRFASRDGAAGSADLFTANDFLRRGAVDVVGPIAGPLGQALEVALVAFLVEYALGHPDAANTATWVPRLEALVPAGVRLGSALRESGDLRAWAATQRPVSFVLDTLLARIPSLV